MKYAVFILAAAALAGCAQDVSRDGSRAAAVRVAPDLSPSRGPSFAPPIRPVIDVTQTRPDLPPPPPPTARTVEQFDTTTTEDRAAAIAPPTAGDRRLGSTIASLGSPTEPGIWFKTPLVTSMQQGRLEYQGNSVNVELRPSGGAAGSGSQISLAAMRLIEAPLTALPEVTVYAR